MRIEARSSPSPARGERVRAAGQPWRHASRLPLTRILAPRQRGTAATMSTAFISVEGLTRRFPEASRQRRSHRVRGPVVRRRRGRVRLRHRPLGLRQVHHPQHPGRARYADSRGHIIAAGKHVAGSEPRPCRDLPGPRADAVAVSALGNVELAVSSRHPDWSRRQVREHAMKYLALGASRRLRAQEAGAALGRHEAARRHRPRAGDRAAHAADGRAVLRARRADARLAAGRGDRHPPPRRARPSS